MGLKERLNQTKRYYNRNGFRKTAIAVTERIFTKENPEFAYKEAPGEELVKQFETDLGEAPKISVLVPAYETKEKY